MCRYFIRVSIIRRMSNIVKELDIAVHTLSSYPDLNNSIKMEVGIEDCLHIEFECVCLVLPLHFSCHACVLQSLMAWDCHVLKHAVL